MNKKIIHFEYCSLDKASKFLSCDIDDIYHWWETNKINLYIKLKDEYVSILSVNNEYIEFKYKDEAFSELNNCKYNFYNQYSSFLAIRAYHDYLSDIFRIMGTVDGLWIPHEQVIINLFKGWNIPCNFTLTPFGGENQEFRLITYKYDREIGDRDQKSPYYFDVTINDICVTKHDIAIMQDIMTNGLSNYDKPCFQSNVGRKESTFKTIALDIATITREKYPTCTNESLARKISQLLSQEDNPPLFGTIKQYISRNTLLPKERDIKLVYELVIPNSYKYLKKVVS